jgi:hypothetical protein
MDPFWVHQRVSGRPERRLLRSFSACVAKF